MLQQRIRYALVFVGLVAVEAVFAARPTGDLNGEVALFPTAAIWFAACLAGWGALITAMLTGPKVPAGKKGQRELGPLIIGTLGTATLLAVHALK